MSVTARERFKALSAKLKASGLKATPQRLAVMKLLAESEGHPSVDDIRTRLQKKFPGISQATVYRTIQLAKSLGEAGAGMRYRSLRSYVRISRAGRMARRQDEWRSQCVAKP